MKTPAIFMDRDGVLINDIDLLTRCDQIQILPGVPKALRLLSEAGFALVMVSNQTVVARGMATEAEVDHVNKEMSALIVAAGGPQLEVFYICPHHPKATLPRYRLDCSCRKPHPGLLLQAAQEHNLDLSSSFMIGDRVTDIIAGDKAGARTILLETGKHTAPAIETAAPIDLSTQATHRSADLLSAAMWILNGKTGSQS
jgi:D-glycero-D-manno-heptose 1,7-bisphosphate phosphatase